mgnify:CR=1 FL=1
MDDIARLSASERQELFRQTAVKFPYLSEAAIEKDFWVCWMLKQLFSSPLKDIIIFKGGTSLAKIFHLIHRFSEDIDLVLNWKDNPVGDPLAQRGYTSQAKFNEKLDSWGVEYIARKILPEVQKCCGNICHAEIQDGKPDNIVITYPKAFSDPYLRPQLLLEIGAKAAWIPHASYRITAYAAEAYPQLFADPNVAIVATTPERSFWEKVTILHAESHRPENSKIRERYSRHYYDTVMISRSPVKQSAFVDLELLGHVAEFKDRFYHSGWADYKNAKPGTMKLLPPWHSIKDLQVDYEKMRTLIYGDYLSFEEIMSALRELEKEINAL